jgi:hypothetical protein
MEVKHMKSFYNAKEMNALADAILTGAGAMQAMPLLTKAGRTPEALAGTASGFISLGLLGAAKNASFKMLTAPRRGFKRNTTRKTARKRR